MVDAAGPEAGADRAPDPASAAGSERYKHLPPPVRLEDTITSQETHDAPDPDGGRNPEQDFFLRFAGGL